MAAEMGSWYLQIQRISCYSIVKKIYLLVLFLHEDGFHAEAHSEMHLTQFYECHSSHTKNWCSRKL
ncbi:hypothetical protein I79_019437 [Cricetulus griseus]|uniref:Uncharacterized protein n=1 Tax=Cricetulus griseus TaxID=10029 RepID=G3I7E9_CRIGR|nr:hypothetical protein I79_019437 [Cricetulus griseus]